VTHANSPLKSLNELKGQQIAFPAPAAFAASILPRAKMESMGLDITPRYVSSHDSVYKSVAKGLFPAGGGVVRTLKALDPDVQKKLRILWTTKSYTPHAFAVHPNLGNEKSKILVRALLRLNDEKYKPLLEPLKFNGIIEANDSHWDDVRALNISLLKF
jgi:phosphonate transport system substrate-binding protein